MSKLVRNFSCLSQAKPANGKRPIEPSPTPQEGSAPCRRHLGGSLLLASAFPILAPSLGREQANYSNYPSLNSKLTII